MNANENTMRHTMTIAASRLALLRARLEALSGRARRRGVESTLRIAEVSDAGVRGVRFHGFNRIEDSIPMVKVTVEGRLPMLDGWNMIGRLETVASGEIIVHEFPTALAAGVDFEALRARGNFCDHCQTRRRRIDLFVLRKGDEVITVGRSCLAEYLRDADAVRDALRAHDLWREADEWFACIMDTMPPRFGGRNKLPVSSFLTCVAAVARQCGYVAARGDNPTGDVALEWVRSVDPVRFATDAGIEMPNADDAAAADAAIAYAATLNGSGYEANLRAACSVAWADPRNARLIASGFASWVRARERRATAAATNGRTGGHVGTVGSELVFTGKVTGKRTFEGRYGLTTLITFVDDSGNLIKWFASGERSDFVDGETYTVKATVKKHGDYQGRAETMITRARKVAAQTSAQPAPVDALEAVLASPDCPF